MLSGDDEYSENVFRNLSLSMETVDNERESEVENEEDDDTKLLLRLWLNERLAPTLLPCAPGLGVIENIMELLTNQQAIISEQDSYTACLYSMECERLKYLLTGYIRCRLAKIESFWMHWLAMEEGSRKILMSPREEAFLYSLSRAKSKAFNTAVLSKLPTPLSDLPWSEGSLKKPNEKAHVICRVREDIGPVQVEPISMTVANLMKDDIYILQYRVAESLLLNNQIELL